MSTRWRGEQLFVRTSALQGIPARTAITALSHPTLDFGFQVLNGTSPDSNDFQQFTCGDIQVK
ncbi:MULTISPECIES: hypothetical protein [unclassified Coleofasciculus]|uniref:hypothetical protein n=1 Tax=Cyanophyceae TaxID=3028117 RepID=UPI001683CEB7|nr:MULTISPECIES: hypothetical protein [unclassified Coleofasciculus]MBD1839111.1 hypothetical protein [Coleofasciculus sp. FACHB-501]MBD2085220.1 hypothetical protein [Coleofasciculus sp. FACHB-542]